MGQALPCCTALGDVAMPLEDSADSPTGPRMWHIVCPAHVLPVCFPVCYPCASLLPQLLQQLSEGWSQGEMLQLHPQHKCSQGMQKNIPFWDAWALKHDADLLLPLQRNPPLLPLQRCRALNTGGMWQVSPRVCSSPPGTRLLGVHY